MMELFRATYGTFDLHMQPDRVVDVTDAVENFIKGDVLYIPCGINFDELFESVTNNGRKFLELRTARHQFFVAADSYHSDVEISLTGNNIGLRIVYFIFLSPGSNWRGIISGQLLQLKSYGIFPEAFLHVELTDCFGLAEQVKALIMEIVPEALVSVFHENQYEYPGIRKVYELAQSYPGDKFIYFHAKGISHQIHTRMPEEVTLFTHTFREWRKNLQYLGHKGVEKAGLFPAIMNKKKPPAGVNGGWIWYNYWYATGNYLRNCQEPVFTENRYYYEGWLSGQRRLAANPINDCKSLYSNDVLNLKYFSAIEADFHLDLIPKQTFKFSRRVIQILASPSAAQRYLQIIEQVKHILRKLGRKS